jgi:hypothetical protein
MARHKPGTPHSVETIARTCAAVLTGKRARHVASEYQIPARTIRHWCQHMNKMLDAQNEKADKIATLLEEYVESNLKTLRAQSEHARNPEWLDKQTAGDIATLHTVLADRTIRILEAAQDAAEARAGLAADSERRRLPAGSGELA